MVYVPTFNEFHIADYVVFVLFLLISLGIGIFFSLSGGRQKSTEEFLMGNRKMSVIPTAISMLVSFTSAIIILGTPSEMYQNGAMYSISAFGEIFARLVSAVVYVPIFYKLRLVSSYEYLEVRFKSRLLRILGSILYLLNQVVYMGIAMYAPSTAMEFVTGGKLKTIYCILLCGGVGTVYTTLGGMKAVIWSDVFQALVMIGGVLAIMIQASAEVGGIGTVFEIAEKHGRLNFNNFSLDPRVRHTFWGLTIGTTISWSGTFGVNQASVQRYCSLPTLKKARASVLFNMATGVIFNLCCSLAGLAIFAYYSFLGCDPIAAGYVQNQNQIVPYFVMEILNFPTVPGLFVAALFAGALSSVSSSLSGVSAIIWKDFLQTSLFSNASETTGAVVTKAIVVVFGVIGTVMGFIAISLGGSVLQACLAFTGAFFAPVLGVFILGMFFKNVGKEGAIIGCVIGAVFTVWVNIGSYVTGKPLTNLPTNTTLCANMTAEVIRNSTTSATNGFLDDLYSISYLWSPPLGTMLTIVIGLLVTGMVGTNNEHLDQKLVHTWRSLCCWWSDDDEDDTEPLRNRENAIISNASLETKKLVDGSMI